MITQEQIEQLKPGDKLIFIRNGQVLSGKKGNVFTFSNWYNNDDIPYPEKRHWQCEEIHNTGNNVHNFDIDDTELFDENIHKDFVLMDEKKINYQVIDFFEKYGS